MFNSFDPVDCSPPGSCLWNSPGKNPGVGCHFFLQGIFLTQGWNLGLPHSSQSLYHLGHQGSPQNFIVSLKFSLLVQISRAADFYPKYCLHLSFHSNCPATASPSSLETVVLLESHSIASSFGFSECAYLYFPKLSTYHFSS